MRQALLYVPLIILFACNEANNTTQTASDTASITVTQDTSVKFSGLEAYFKEDANGRINSKLEIPKSLIEKITGEEISDEYISSIHPTNHSFNDHCYFFILEYECGAGGYCAMYYLMMFDKKGKFISNRKIGSEAGELNWTSSFEYVQFHKDTLRTYHIQYDEENDETIDTVVKNIILKPYSGETKLTFLDSVRAKLDLSPEQIKAHSTIDGFDYDKSFFDEREFYGDTVYFSSRKFPIAIINADINICRRKILLVYNRANGKNTDHMQIFNLCDDARHSYHKTKDFQIINDSSFYVKELSFKYINDDSSAVIATTQLYIIDEDGRLWKKEEKEERLKPVKRNKHE